MRSRLTLLLAFNLSTVDEQAVDGYHRFQLLPPVEQYLLSDRKAIVCHDPALLAEFLAHSKQVIDLTIDDDKNDDNDDDDDDAHVSWLGNPRTAQYRVRLIPPSLINCFQIADHLPSPSTALLAKFTHTRCQPQKRHLQRPHMAGSIIHGRMYLPGRHCVVSTICDYMSHMGKCLLVDQPFALATPCTASFNSIPSRLLITKQLMRFTP